MRSRLMTILLLLAAPAGARAAGAGDEQPAWFSHLPPAEASYGEAITIEARIDRAWNSTMEVRFRTIGDSTWRAETFQRGTAEDEYRATVPADAVRAPGVEYFIVGAAKDGGQRPHFASETDPHQVMVYEDSQTLQRTIELARLKGRRAKARTSFEVVDFGKRRSADDTKWLYDWYVRAEADFSYRVLRFPLYSLRFGSTYLYGQTPGIPGSGTVDDNPDCDVSSTCTDPIGAGFKVSGWFEMRVRLSELIEADGRGIVAATIGGFNVGARLEGRIGSERGSHVALGWEGIVDAGTSVFLRLGWDTVKRFPMSTTIEITNMPSPARDYAVRLVYDVIYPLESGFTIGARVGYQAREEKIGGPTAGLNLSLDF